MLQNLKTPSKCEKSHIACLVSSLRPFPLLFKCRRLLLFNKFLQKCLLYRVGLEHWKICLHGQCFYNSVITSYLSQSEHGKHTWASQSPPSSSFFPPLSLLFLSFPPSLRKTQKASQKLHFELNYKFWRENLVCMHLTLSSRINELRSMLGLITWL